MPYTFTAEDFTKFSEDVVKAEGDQATVTTILADMQGTIQDAIAKDVANTQKVADLTAENERLKTANMQLFLRIGTPADPKPAENEQEVNSDKSATERYMDSYFEKIDKN